MPKKRDASNKKGRGASLSEEEKKLSNAYVKKIAIAKAKRLEAMRKQIAADAVPGEPATEEQIIQTPNFRELGMDPGEYIDNIFEERSSGPDAGDLIDAIASGTYSTEAQGGPSGATQGTVPVSDLPALGGPPTNPVDHRPRLPAPRRKH